MGFIIKYNWVLVLVQICCLFYLTFLVKIIPDNMIIGFIMVVGVLLGVWSVLHMQLNNLSIFPKVKKQARFIQTGPYKHIRHPMYTSLLLFFIPMLINDFKITRGFTSLILVLNLIFKMHVEEYFMDKRFADYKKYKIETYRIIPFVY